jgi:hypothetical protein
MFQQQIEQEDSGLPMLVVFGEHDALAKDGVLIEVRAKIPHWF